jgi:DNA modification methylase
MCVTSPPYYGLRDYGNEDAQIGLEESPEEFIAQLVEVFRQVRDVLEDDGTLWVNIGDSYYNYRPGKGQRINKQSVSKTLQDLPQEKCPRRGNKLDGLKDKDLIGIPWMLAFALRADGWYLRQDIIWSKPNPMPESMKDRCTKSHEYIFLFSKSKNYYFDVDSIREPTVDGNDLKRKRSVWEVQTKPYKEGDIILDPFMGSGTTAAVAKYNGRNYIGCELHQDYGNLIERKVKEFCLRVPPKELAQDPQNALLDALY